MYKELKREMELKKILQNKKQLDLDKSLEKDGKLLDVVEEVEEVRDDYSFPSDNVKDLNIMGR